MKAADKVQDSLHELFVQGQEKVKALVLESTSLLDTYGYLHRITLRGGFVVPQGGYDGDFGWGRFWDAFDKGAAHLKESVIDVFGEPLLYFKRTLSEGFNASRASRVELEWRYDPERSAIGNNKGRSPSFLVTPKGFKSRDTRAYIFYNFALRMCVGRDEVLLMEITGLPHFLVPATISILGDWLTEAVDMGGEA